MTDSPTREAQTPELTLQALKAAFRQSPVPSAAERKHKLTELKKQLSRYQDVFADAASSDFGGRPAFESRLIETVGTTWVVDHARRNVAKWMKPEGRWPQMLFSLEPSVIPVLTTILLPKYVPNKACLKCVKN